MSGSRSRPRQGGTGRRTAEYVRHGTCAIFVWVESLAGKRRVVARARRPALTGRLRSPGCSPLTIPTRKQSSWSWTTSTPLGSVYEASAPAKAHALAQRLEIHYTPKRGSWLNIAETELAALTRQCLDRRIDDLDALNIELTAWQNATNADRRQVHWHFTADDARTKLRRLYPERLTTH